MKEIKALKELLRWLKKLRRGVRSVSLIALVLLSSGCIKTHATNSFCLWAKPIELLTEEVDLLSDLSARQIDDYNQELEKQCRN